MKSKCYKVSARSGGGWKVILFDHCVEIGYADVQFKYDDTVEIVWFQIHSLYRGRGLGKLLLQDILDYFPNKRVFIWSVIESARPFWEKMKANHPIYEE